MSVASLPDLNALPGEALRALILAQHEQLLSAEDRLTATQEQLQSREREIEHLQLLLAKLHRMQFGRKSEKLQRQIEQLELRLEELESHRSEKECNAAEPDNPGECPRPGRPLPYRHGPAFRVLENERSPRRPALDLGRNYLTYRGPLAWLPLRMPELQ